MYTLANELGFFSFRDLEPGTYVLTVTRIGFREYRQQVSVEAGATDVEVMMDTEAIVIGGVTVEAQRSRAKTRFEESAGITVQEIEAAALKSLPVIAESDPLRAIEVLPGVTTVSDFSAAFNIRGGSADQNLILLDEVPLFNPFHLGGVSDQVQVGAETFFGDDDDWFASLEGYYRTFDGVASINSAEDPNDDTDALVAGDGNAYGVYLYLKRDRGTTTGWISISFLKTVRSFPDTRVGIEPRPWITYPPVFDRRLEVDLALRRPLDWWRLELGVRANFGTGLPFTRPLGTYHVYRTQLVGGVVDPDDGNAVLLGPRNGARYPARHRPGPVVPQDLILPAIGELRTELRPRRATHFALTTEDLRSLGDRSQGKPWQSFYAKTQCGTTISARLQPDLAQFLLMLGDPESLPARSGDSVG